MAVQQGARRLGYLICRKCGELRWVNEDGSKHVANTDCGNCKDWLMKAPPNGL